MKCIHKKKRDANAHESKLFLNVVHSEQVAEPTARKSGPDGASWSVPYALGPLRMERDKLGNNLVPTFDCCFHPSSLRHAHGRKGFLDLVVDIVKDAARTAFEESGDAVEILPGYTILRGVSYKSGTPKSLLIGCNDTHGEEEKKGEGVDGATSTSSLAEAACSDKNDEGTDPLVPEYKIVEQGVFDIADHTTRVGAPAPRRPRRLNVTVYLDKAKSAADINLDVSERLLVIKPDPKSDVRYSLELELPYAVNSQKGNARFDAKQRTLVVSLPVVV